MVEPWVPFCPLNVRDLSSVVVFCLHDLFPFIALHHPANSYIQELDLPLPIHLFLSFIEFFIYLSLLFGYLFILVFLLKHLTNEAL